MSDPIVLRVGIPVWFWASLASKRGLQQPEAAIVTHLHSALCVNLTVFDANGDPRPIHYVNFIPPVGLYPTKGEAFCEVIPESNQSKLARYRDLERRVSELEQLVRSFSNFVKAQSQSESLSQEDPPPAPVAVPQKPSPSVPSSPPPAASFIPGTSILTGAKAP